MANLRPWMACVRLNRHDKAYFLHQWDGFSKIVPLLVTWDDRRPDAEQHATQADTDQLETPWQTYWRFPGGHRVLDLLRRVKGAVMRGTLGAGRAEMAVLSQLADRAPPSVIYAHTAFVGLRLLPFAKLRGVPLVVHFHGLDVTKADPVYRRELRRALPQFARVIVVGQWMVARLVALGCDPARISVVPMGAVTGDIPAAVPRTDQDLRFIAVGRLVGVKGLDRTIAAFAQVHAAHPNATLHLVGDGPLRATLTAQAADLGLGEAVVFHGQVPAEQTLHLVADADVLVHHALDHPGGPEAFGVVITEAMARGLPVVGTRCGGLPDQIIDTETGLLVDQDDVAGMAEAMLRLAGDAGLRAAMGAAGQARARAHFDAHVLARQVEDILLQEAG